MRPVTRTIAVLLCGALLAPAVSAAGPAGAAPGPEPAPFAGAGIQGGFEAQAALGPALASGRSAEAMTAEGFRAQQLMQGLSQAGKPPIEARGWQPRGQGGAGVAGGPSTEGLQGMRVSEPPLPGIDPAPANGGDAKKKPSEWLKVIQTWLPIAVFFYISVMTIINPVGMAAQALQGVAMWAIIGTATQLYKLIKNKPAK